MVPGDAMQTCRLPGGVLEKNPLASSASALYTGFTEQGTHGILGTDVFGTEGAQVRYARKKKKSSWCTFCPCRETTAGAFPLQSTSASGISSQTKKQWAEGLNYMIIEER